MLTQSHIFVYNNAGEIKENEKWTKFDNNQSSKLDKLKSTISNSKPLMIYFSPSITL